MIKPYSYYNAKNETAKTLVLLAGSAEGQYRWVPFLDKLLEKFNVVLIDNPGVNSNPYLEDFSAESLALEYQNYLNELNIDNYYLLGHSFGSFIAQNMAYNEPEKVDKLILVGSSIGSFNQVDIINFQLWATQEQLKAKDDINKQTLDYKSLFSPDFSFEQAKNILIERTNGLNSKKTSFAYVLNSAKHNSFNIIHKITTPTLIVHGREDKIIDFDNALQLLNLMQSANLLSVPNTGHYPYLENPNVMEDIISFLLGKNVKTIFEKGSFNSVEIESKNLKFTLATKDMEDYKNLLCELFVNKENLSLEQRQLKFFNYINK